MIGQHRIYERRIMFGGNRFRDDINRITNTQYYDLIFPWEFGRPLDRALRALVKPSQTVVEIGSGTGLFTEIILDVVGGDGEIFAIEPSGAMRSCLMTRLSSLSTAAGVVTVLPVDALSARIDVGADVVVLFNVLANFNPSDRIKLWSKVAQMLRPGGIMLMDFSFREELVDVPAMVRSGSTMGRRYYDSVVRGEVIDHERMKWILTYRTHEGDQIVHEDTAEFEVYIASQETVTTELASAGLRPLREQPQGVFVCARN